MVDRHLATLKKITQADRLSMADNNPAINSVGLRPSSAQVQVGLMDGSGTNSDRAR